MGILISRFRKKKNTTEQLEEIEKKIRSIEKFHKETERQFRYVIGKLIFSSIIVYIIVLCGYYYYFSPDTFRENILKFIPLLVFPVAIFLSRRILSWYYERKLTNNEISLKNLKSSKKKILDEVMDKETYKVAKEILEKYAPEQLNGNSAEKISNIFKSLKNTFPVSTTQILRDNMVARQRTVSNSVTPKKQTDIVPPQTAPPRQRAFPLQPRSSLPRPILPRDRSPMDKLIDLIIGDGPNNRYALICRVCSSHNGMALKHDFEYLAFRCAYCMQWNPPKRMKPQAPNLPLDFGSEENELVNADESKKDNDNVEETNELQQLEDESCVSETTVGEDRDRSNCGDVTNTCDDSEKNEYNNDTNTVAESHESHESHESVRAIVSSQSENVCESIELADNVISIVQER